MKKLKLDFKKIEGAEALTRDQLKRILGGSEPVTTNHICTCEDGATAGVAPGDGAQAACESYCYDHGGGGTLS